MGQQFQKRPRRFTGYHATAIIVAFFAVVIAVNLTMARFAVSTFGGTVVENSYVASQKFNGWLEEARQEKALGWTVSRPVRHEGHILLSITDALDQPLTGALVLLRADHPLGHAPTQELRFAEVSPGRFRSVRALPEGRWKLRAHIERDGRELNLTFEVN